MIHHSTIELVLTILLVALVGAFAIWPFVVEIKRIMNTNAQKRVKK